MKRNLKRIISLAAAVILILCTALPASADQAEILPGTEEESVFPDAEPMLSALTSTMTRWEGTSNAITFPGLGDGVVKSEMLHQVDGQLAYCIDNSLKFSEGTAVEISTAEAISKTQWANEAAFRKAALAEWYVNNECSRYSLTGYQKNWLTQILIWCLCSNNLSWNRMAENGPSIEVQDKIISAYPAWYEANGSKFNVSWHIYINGSAENPQPVATFSAAPAKGSLNLKKVSADPSITEGSSIYSLAGAEYGVYGNMDDLNADNRCATLITGPDGTSQTVELDEGTYFVREVKAPYGFRIDEKTYSVTVTASKTETVTSKEVPLEDPAVIHIEKRCADYGAGYDIPSLEGTEFTLTFYAGHFDSPEEAERAVSENKCIKREWVIKTKAAEKDGKVVYRAELNESYLISGDELYINENNLPVLPLGSLLIRETKAADGYTTEGATYTSSSGQVLTGDFFQKIISDTSGVHLEYQNTYTAENRIIRADIEIIKTDADTGSEMADVSFLLTNETTGEEKTITTDLNGRYSSKETDLWFGEGDKKEGSGALTFGHYTLVELRGDANRNKKLETRQFDVTPENAGEVISFDIENETITIGTTATDKADGDKYLAADADVTVIDRVAYKNLTPGRKYTLKGKAMNKNTGKPVTSGGKELTVTKTFSPLNEEGTVDMEFSFNSAQLKGVTIVIFEELYEESPEDITPSTPPVASHTDINDTEQTVKVKGRISTSTSARPSNTGSRTSNGRNVSTGDSMFRKLALYAAILILAAASAGAVIFIRRRKL